MFEKYFLHRNFFISENNSRNFFQHLTARLMPGPYLGRDIIEDLDIVLFGKFGHPDIEAGIVNQDEYIGFVRQYIPLAKTDVFKNGENIKKHLPESHESKVPVMLYNHAPLLLH